MSRKLRHAELPKGYTLDTDVIIESGDGIRVSLPYRYASRCSAVRHRLQDEKEIEPDGTVKFMNVSGAALTRVIDYCRYEWPDDSSAFDTDLIGRPQIPFQRYLLTANPSVLCELASASYYLDVKPLVDLTCRAIADNIKGKSPEEIRSTFNIVNDFTPAEEEEVRQSVMKRTLLMPVEQDPTQITTPFNTTSAQAAGMTGIPYNIPPVSTASPSVAASYHVRNKLRSKLHHKQTSTPSTRSKPIEDKRSVDDLMSFIDGSATNDKKKKKSKNKTKKPTSPSLTPTTQPNKTTTKPATPSTTSTPSTTTTSTSNGTLTTSNRRSSTSASTSTSTSASTSSSVSAPASTSSTATPSTSTSTSTSISTAPRPLQWDASLLQDEDDHTSHQEAERFKWLLEGMHHQPTLAGDDRLLDPSIMSNIVSYAGPLTQPEPVANDISTQAMSLARNLAAAISALHPPTSTSTSTTVPTPSPSPPPLSVTFTIEPIDGLNGKLLVSNLLHELGKIRYPDFDDSPNVESLKPHEVIPPNGVFIVAHIDGRPGGCAALRSLKLALPRRIVELKRMYTEPWTRGRGVGKALMIELEKWARDNGYEGIWLETGKRQPEAIALYYKCGYVDMEPFEEPFDANLSVFMKKEWTFDEKTSTSLDQKAMSTPTFKIQSTTHSHATLLIDHFHAELKQRYPDYDFTSHITSFQQSLHEMSPPHGIFMIGYLDNKPAVCGGLAPMKQALPRRVYELKRVWVEPWARGRGAARHLMNELETWATSQHYSAIWLMTGKRQPEAIALYRSCGYTEMTPWEEDADPTLTTYMRKSLDVDEDDGDADTTDIALQALIDAKLSGLSTWEKQQEQDGDENEDVTATVAAEAAARGDFDFLLKNAASTSTSAPAPALSTQPPHPRPSLSESTDDPVSVTIHEHEIPKRGSDGEIHFSGPAAAAADALVTNCTNGHADDDNEMPPLEVSPLEDGTSLADTMMAGICTCISSPSSPPIPSDPISTATIEALSAVCPWISSMSPSIRVCSTCGLIRLPPNMQNIMAPAGTAAAAEQQTQATTTAIPVTQTNGTRITASTTPVQAKPNTVAATPTTTTSSPTPSTTTAAPHPITADMAGKQCPMHHRTASTVAETPIPSTPSPSVSSIPTSSSPTTPSTVSSDVVAHVAQLEARVTSLEQQLREETARRIAAEHTEQRLKAFEQRLMHLEMNKKKR